MALSGSIAGYTSNANITARIDWSAEQSVSGNYSIITAELYYMKPAGFSDTYGTMNCAIHIGSYSKSFSGRVTIPGGGEVCVFTFAQKVYHADNGELTVPISATGAIPGTSLEWTSLEDDVQLDTIARASTIAATDANIGATSMIAVNVRSSSFTHTIRYQFGSLSGYIDEDGAVTDHEVKHTATYIPFIVPEDFYGVIPGSRSGKCVLTCKTYSDDNFIGESTCTFTASTQGSECTPYVTGTVEDINEKTLAVTGNKNVLVQYMSTALCTITAEARHGAYISETMINNVDVDDTQKTIEGVEISKFVFYAQDSRGYTTSVTVWKSFVPYIRLTCNASVRRTDPTSGRAVLTVKGNYFNGSFGAENNELTVTYSVNGGTPVEVDATINGNSYTASVEITGLDYQQSHDIVVDVRDKLVSVPKPCTVNKGLPVFDWGENDFRFNVPVTDSTGSRFIKASDILNMVYPVGSYYISANGTSPEILFGGKWQRIEGRFLWAAPSTGALGVTGGEAEHTLTNDELPDDMGTFIALCFGSDDGTSGIVSKVQNKSNLGYSGGSSWGGATYTLAGGGQAHNNMPPYISAAIWRRIA